MVNKVDTQSVLRRAYKDTEHCIGFLWYQGVVAMTTLVSGITGAFFYPSNATALTQAEIGAIAAFIGFLAILGLTFLITLLLAPYRQRNEARKQLAGLIYPPKALHIFFDASDPNCVDEYEDFGRQFFVTHYRIGIKNIGATSIYKVKVNLVNCSRQSSTGTTTLLSIRPDVLEPLGIHENGSFELVPNVPKYVTILDYPPQYMEDQIYISYLHQAKYTTRSLSLVINMKYLIELVLDGENVAQAKCALSIAKGELGRLTIQLEEII